MDKINLEQIIRDQLTEDNWYMVNTVITSIVKAMKIACDNTVDLCSENADANINWITEYSKTPQEGEDYEVFVVTNSILKVKELIK